MKLSKPLLIGGSIMLCLFVTLCGAFFLFVNWSNSDDGQATFRRVETKEAIANATAAVQSTQKAKSDAQAAATGTAVMLQIDDRLKKAQPLFEDALDKDSPFLKANIGDFTLSFEDDSATIGLPWDGFRIWQIEQKLVDFAAEMDCSNDADSIGCGFAYGIQPGERSNHYYASLIAGSSNCGFFDHTSDFTISNYPLCDYPRSSKSFLQHLRLEKFGANVRFYVNGKLIDQRVLAKPEFLSGGFGLIFGRAGGEQSDINKVHLKNFKVWQLP